MRSGKWNGSGIELFYGSRRASRRAVVRAKLGPNPFLKFIIDRPDIVEAHVLKSGNLNGSDIKMFYNEVCIESRDAVIRAKIKLEKTFLVHEFSSISTLEMAWEGYPWGTRVHLLGGEVTTMTKEYFSTSVALTNDLKLLRWVREEKECAWNYHTSGEAASNGNLEMLKYCVENGCEVHAGACVIAARNGHLDCLEYLRSKNIPWNEWVCQQDHEKNHIDCLTYAVKNKCPGFEAFEQFLPK